MALHQTYHVTTLLRGGTQKKSVFISFYKHLVRQVWPQNKNHDSGMRIRLPNGIHFARCNPRPVLAPCWDLAGIVLASCWHRAGIVLAWCWHGAGIVQFLRFCSACARNRVLLRIDFACVLLESCSSLLESCWHRVAIAQESCWNRAQVVFGSCWNRARVVIEQCWNGVEWCRNRAHIVLQSCRNHD